MTVFWPDMLGAKARAIVDEVANGPRKAYASALGLSVLHLVRVTPDGEIEVAKPAFDAAVQSLMSNPFCSFSQGFAEDAVEAVLEAALGRKITIV